MLYSPFKKIFHVLPHVGFSIQPGMHNIIKQLNLFPHVTQSLRLAIQCFFLPPAIAEEVIFSEASVCVCVCLCVSVCALQAETLDLRT